jgi:hypothetical protein
MRFVPSITLLALALTPTLALADATTASFEATVVRASKDGAVDPRVADLAGKFDETAYRSLQLVSRESVEAKQGQMREVALPGGKSLHVTYKERDGSGRAVCTLEIPGVVKQTQAIAPGFSTEIGGKGLRDGSGVIFVSVKLVQVK